MQKMKAVVLLSALFIFSYTMSSDKTQSDSFKSFDDVRATGSDIQPLISPYAEGISSGSGDFDDTQSKSQYPAPQKRWHWTEADVFILPDSPEPHRPRKPIIPKLNLTPREKLDDLKQIEKHEKISADQKKQQKISNAIAFLQQQTPDSTRETSSEIKTSKRRVLSEQQLNTSPETLRRIESREKSPDLTQKVQWEIKKDTPQLPITPPNTPERNLTPKTGSASISQHQSIEPSPQISPGNVISKIDNKLETSSSSSDQITPSPIHTPSPTPTPSHSPRTPDSENYSPESLKIPQKSTNSQEKKDDTKINNTTQETNPTSMRPLTWKDGGTALLTIAGLLSLLYYLDKLPANISAKIDNLLALLRMNG